MECVGTLGQGKHRQKRAGGCLSPGVRVAQLRRPPELPRGDGKPRTLKARNLKKAL